MRRIGLLVVLGLGLAAASAQADTTTAGGLRLVKVGDFVAPVLATGPTGDPERLFVVERGDGGGAASRIVLVRNGARLASPFLDLSQFVEAESSERGLLSMAFAPDYAASGLIYVYYTRRDDPATPAIDERGAIQVDEYRRSAVDPDRADPASRRPVLTELHPVDGNHNGGHLAFGPDGFLYASLGDGGGSNNVHLNAQSLATLLGKVIRIDPRESPGYAIPPDNPFVGRSGARGEIYAYGLRNPFRFSFDRLTGDLVIGDVGQSAWEEVDFTARGRASGVNFGWSRYEAFTLNAGGFDPSLDTAGPYVPPVLDRSHGDGFCAVTGGYVVRDPSVAALTGRYLFGDYCKGDLETAVLAPGSATAQTTTGLRVDQVAGFGEDGRCRIHVTSYAGSVYRLETVAPPAVAAACPVPGASVPLPPTTAIVDRTRPSIVTPRFSRTRFGVGRAPTVTVAAVGRGTVLRYRLTEAAGVTIRVERRLGGQRVKGSCVAPSTRRRAPRCTRIRTAGALTRRQVAGDAAVAFSGRIGTRALPAGSYRVTIRARDAAGNVSLPRRVGFAIVAR